MSAKWVHPQLGKFEFDDIHMQWISEVSMPAFKSFEYDTGYSNARRSTGEHELAFEAEDEADVPSPEAVALADKMLAEQKNLVSKVITALWTDFAGAGPRSGMWWHGDLDAVKEDLEESIESAEDLLTVLQLSQVIIRKGLPGYERPIIELSFHAAFEIEHGVGVLSDGDNILGTGYSFTVTPFKDLKSSK